MLFYIRYTQGLGDNAIYTRLRGADGYFWDFSTQAWVGTEISDCRVYLLERDDYDSVDSLYSAEASLPAGGPWVEETVLVSSNRVLGYDNTSVPIESTQLTLAQMLFAYIGNANNVFSKVCGSFIGTLDFYACSFTQFENNMADPGGTRVCTLASTGVMSNVTDIATSGEVLYFKMSSNPAFSALVAAPTINIYSATNTGNTRVYVPIGVQYVASLGAYYPTTDSGLLVYENSNLISLGETAYGKALAMIPNINWDRISQPVQLTTTAVIV
jgi:hypothetical protein